jgi:hypothetical protein
MIIRGAVLAVVASLLLPAWPAPASAQPPAIAINPHIYTSPKPVVEGDVVGHVFEVRNTGKTPIEIRSVRTGCACVTADYERRIAPGRSGFVALEFDTRGYRGMVSQKAQITTTDPAAPSRLVQLRAEVIPAVETVPDRVFFYGPAEDERTAEVAVVSHRKEALHLTLDSAHSQLPEAIDYRLEPMNDGRKYRLTVADHGRQVRTYRGRLVFDTGSTVRPKLVVPIFGKINPDIEAIPAKIEFTVRSGKTRGRDAALEKAVIIRSNRDADVTIRKIEIDSERFDARVTPVVEKRIYRVALTCRPAGFTAGAADTEMVVYMNEKEEAVLRIPVRVLIK